MLAGGGLAGIGWETGVLRGIADESPRTAKALLEADVLVGTSAGSTVAAQLGSGLGLHALFDRQTATPTAELNPGVGIDEIAELFVTAMLTPNATTAEKLQKIGTIALSTATVTEAVRRDVIAQRLPSHDWPERVLRISIDLRSVTVIFRLLDLEAVLSDYQRVDGHLFRLDVEFQLEPAGQQRLQHPHYLGFVGRTRCLSDDVKSFVRKPARTSRDLILSQAKCSLDAALQRHIRVAKPTVLDRHRNAKGARLRLMRLHRCHLEFGTGRGGLGKGAVRAEHQTRHRHGSTHSYSVLSRIPRRFCTIKPEEKRRL